MSEISKQALKVDNSQSFPDNNAGAITPSDLRAFNVNMIDSLVDEIGYNVDSASWNNSISNLNTFTSSQQPTFTALNSFTASQLTINTGVNTFTQSANGRLTVLENDTANLEAFTSSINQILVNGVSIGTSTRFFFNGFVSASIVPNVNGAIASITVLSDPSLTPTASFNQYTASTAATQLVFSASVANSFSQSNVTFNAFSQSQNSFNLSATASIVELLNLSSSLSGGYATQGELDQSSSVLQANIDTKLNTSSFNQYTQSTAATQSVFSSSVANQFTTQSILNGTLATTGSNTFRGDEIISGNVFVSGAVRAWGNGYDFEYGTYTSDFLGGAFNLSPNKAISSIEMGANQEAKIEMYANGGNYDTFKVFVDSGSNGIQFQDYPDATSYETWMGVGTSTTGNLGDITLYRNTNIIGNSNLTGSLTITGSVYGNVLPITTSASTTSIDLSVANYFTLTLSGSTNINVTNPRAGVTATLVINTDTGASASFSSNVKQPSGSLYVASPSGNVDIISFTAVNSTTVYAFPAQSFV